MTVTVTIRPGARTEISGLPYSTKNPGENYELLGEAIGASKKGQVKYANRSFSVARSHTLRLLDALIERFGSVRVIHYGGLTMCVEACWKVGKPEKAATCECSCAGANHGSQQPIGPIVSESGPAGALSVASGGRREYWLP